MSSDQEATCILKENAILGEGALWHPIAQVLYWVDIEGKALHIYDPEKQEDRLYDVNSRIGTVVPVEEGGAIVALESGIHHIDIKTGNLTLLTNPLKKQPGIRFNDGKCGPDNRFWVGTMALDKREGAAVLYKMEADGSIKQMLDNLTISNGIAWSLDAKTMYLSDTPTQTIFAFDFNSEKGEISNRRKCIEIPKSEGSPDGMTLDAAGNLWIALFGGAAVACYAPETGKMISKVKVPAPNVTSCAFGGPELDVLYITTGWEGLSDEQLQKYPDSGNLFSVKTGSKGIAANFYKMEKQVS
ncbi:SMP-30/gluconolactonase/LRE family protein [Pontibacter arcticus]|uniref:SMP-30/gluconolactonase/LRE family protein n=1 Tax=Pontibacter arcticus TaxID=2080288 RepID=A0A364RFB8_9BACT|nr:SMP-30/gluconolactonase/LRE family protein [Pontibacter arcticus]RAU83048.1 SMP-30/gluconolactonase/LRE family protein [Pontibacter arcticus]